MVSRPWDGLAETRTAWNPWVPSQNGSASRRNAKDTVGAGFGKYQAPEVSRSQLRACPVAHTAAAAPAIIIPGTRCRGAQKGLSRADESALMAPFRVMTQVSPQGGRGGHGGFVAGAPAWRPWASGTARTGRTSHFGATMGSLAHK